MDIYEGGQKVIPVSEKPDTSVKTTTSEPPEEVVHELKMRPYREYFGTQPYEDEKLESVIKWANPKGTLSKDEVMAKIKHVDSFVGEGRLGETQLEKVWKFVTLIKSVANLSKTI